MHMTLEKFTTLQLGKNDVGKGNEILMKMSVLLVSGSGCQIDKRMTSSECPDSTSAYCCRTVLSGDSRYIFKASYHRGS